LKKTVVTYKDMALREYRGELIDQNKGNRGGDCHVKWYTPYIRDYASEECLFNLLIIDT
jgi:hypothetical protein